MNYVVGFDAAARADLKELYDYLVVEAGEIVAQKYVNEILNYCAGFETFPKRGISRNDISQGLRLVGYRRRATIAFRVHRNQVSIVRIFHRGKNITP